MSSSKKSSNRIAKKLFKTFTILLILFFLIYFVVVPWVSLNFAATYYSKGNYSEALRLYEQSYNKLFFGEKTYQGCLNIKSKLAELAIEKGDYSTAIHIYSDELGLDNFADILRDEAGDYYKNKGDYDKAIIYYKQANKMDKVKEIYIIQGDLLLAAGDYENALIKYTNASSKTKQYATHIAWGDHIFEIYGDAEEALEHYVSGHKYGSFIVAAKGERRRVLENVSKQIENGDIEKVPSLLRFYVGDDVAQLMYEAVIYGKPKATSTEAINMARSFGSTIKDTDTQLTYSHLLYQYGFDLKEIYPDGVEVDEDLSQYQFYYVDKDEDPNCSALIVFSRTETMPSLEPIYRFSYSTDELFEYSDSKRLENKDVYTVKLHPELMTDLFEKNQAWSKKNCTSIVLLESGYVSESALCIHSSYSPGFDKMFLTNRYSIYYEYSAYNAVIIYEKDKPLRNIAYGFIHDTPLSYNSIVKNYYSDSGIDLTFEQIEEIQNATLKGKESEEYLAVVEKYGQDKVDLVDKNGWGEYALFPKSNDPNETSFLKCTSNNVSTWNIPKYMIGSMNESWIGEQIENDMMLDIALYAWFQ